MATILSSPYSYFSDANGNPLAGGKVYTYVAGTSTPLATYTDSTLTTPNANPVILDSAGRAVIWLSGTYKITVTDSTDVVIRTVDNIAGTGANGDMLKATYDPANIQEQLVGLTAAQTLSNKTLGSTNVLPTMYLEQTIASATTTDLASGGSKGIVSVSGTTTITSFGSGASTNYPIYFVRFTGVLTLTHNATSLILPTSANITTAAGDSLVAKYEGSGNWRVLSYSRADGSPLSKITLATAQNTTSGTSIDFTGIPSSVKRITFMFNGMSTTGSSDYLIQIGSGSITSSGYKSTASAIITSVGTISQTAGFVMHNNGYGTAGVLQGTIVFTLLSSNTWTSQGVLSWSNVAGTQVCAGVSPALGGALDRIRLTTTGGTDTFDAGSVNISYE